MFSLFPVKLKKRKWKFGRMRNPVGTRAEGRNAKTNNFFTLIIEM